MNAISELAVPIFFTFDLDMTTPHWLKIFGLTVLACNLTLPAGAQTLPAPACEAPVLKRLQSHTVVTGETLTAIAGRYQLLPETLQHFNPRLASGRLTNGISVLIPPYNGFQVNVPSGATWRDLGEAYGVRPDVLFELNGCQAPGTAAFIPSRRYANTPAPNAGDLYEGLAVHPLPGQLNIGLAYGWYEQGSAARTFHNGLDLLAPIGSPVQAAAAGVVAFADTEGDYGRLIVINHDYGRQTRYAHLGIVEVKVGTQVSAGQRLGTVGQTGQPDLPAPHLHFEVRQQAPVGWIAQDPALHLRL